MAVKELDRYLKSLDAARRDLDAALANYRECSERYEGAFTPIGRDPSEEQLAKLYAMCPAGSGYPRSYIFVYLVLLCYAPSSLFGGRIPLALAKCTAAVVGVKPPAIYTARRKVVWWINVYRDFYNLVFRLYERIVREDVIIID